MSTVWSSQVVLVVLATTLAVSGTMVLLLLCRDKATFTENAIGNQESGGSGHAKTGVGLRSCLSSGKKDGRVVKKVRFSEDVKDSSEKNDEYRKAQREGMMYSHVSYGTQPISFDDGFVNKNLTMLVEFSN
ncbi:hypothetical protein CTI12_AA101210 [Artemisia annua]|uniref:Uncharacterized protein n=1 Tax=Artemisia annua TaxID=35608 RepID=A0A2U1PX55_ARTAN|nr:hypothetical protein CTI12_AA101210 [Artemisia annua]